jgi:hypothetical protein
MPAPRLDWRLAVLIGMVLNLGVVIVVAVVLLVRLLTA